MQRIDLKEIFNGLRSYKSAHQVIVKLNLWPLMSVPGILSCAYIVFLIVLGVFYLDDMARYINANQIPEILQSTVITVIIDIMLWLLLLVIGYMTYRQIILILFSPILAYISETVESKVYNEASAPFNLTFFFKDIIRSVIINTRSLALMFVMTLLAWLSVLVPLICPIVSAILIVSIQAYFSGTGLIDYTLERKRFSVRESIQYAREHRSDVMGLGLGFMLLLLIPVIGWFMAPGYGAVASMLATLEKVRGVP
ncbi:EI24 domain-containing protein [Desulfococcaceae bacterium HSG9]|nr:EI24 domain-containing protein [Desulfococcaceae bacterium HSG9]